MSKKSRRRNKKILAALALAGGAAMMAKRKKASIADMDDAALGVTHSALKAGPYITKKVAAPASKWISPRMFGHGPNAGSAGQKIRANVSNRVTDVVNPMLNAAVGSSNPRRPNIYKKGGRVTGAAKRGFGRALMKGKK